MDIEAKLSLPIPRTRSNSGYPIKRKPVVSDKVKEAISELAHKGASFLSIEGNRITVRINDEILIVNV